ncbi:MAG: tRNA (guanosine(37)-N1)-methyltransferase TrmD [Nitrospirae bacterium]|nr:tRNA (guanosine(37)-N1)-methyltransferase TrmD [Nitrospirota bacterium]
MECIIVTLFPEMVQSVLSTSILKRAGERGLLKASVVNLRDFTEDKHQSADDSPYGGGAGMVLKPEPIFRAVGSLTKGGNPFRLILLSPQGRCFDQEMALSFSRETRKIVFLCGRYEGVDERVRIGLQPEEISIGDYVLSGGELPALVMIEAATRLIPGALGDETSAVSDSFQEILDYPHFTRPPVFRGMEVPEVLLSGNHERIRRWRRKEALRSTWQKRPDLLNAATFSREDLELLEEIKQEEGVVGHT